MQASAASLNDPSIPHTKVVICGEASVGKSTVFVRLLNQDISDCQPSTMGAAFSSTNEFIYEGKQVPINLWDTAGQEAYRSLVNIYFRRAEIALIVFDLTRKETFEQILDWIDAIHINTGIENTAIAIIGNKADLADQRDVDDEFIQKLTKEENVPYFEVSAFENSNINALYSYIAETAYIKSHEKPKEEKAIKHERFMEEHEGNNSCCK